MKKLRLLFLGSLCLLFIFSSTLPATALELSKGLPHYAREMEFYYQKERPEILNQLFQNFYKNGILAKGENRLMLAAFFAELVKKGKLRLDDFIAQNAGLGKDARHTLAWTSHLSGIANEEAYLNKVLGNDEKALREQIKHSPRQLSSWSLNSEKSVIQMYWAAYMACGNPQYPEAILACALNFARSQNSPSAQRDPHGTGSAAAASLYDLALRHPAVKARAQELLASKSGNEKLILRMILHEKID